MRSEHDAVAGFFEDLPVLMFVLLGVSVLVISGAWVSRENASRELEGRLDEVAQGVAQTLVEHMHSEWGSTPRLSSLMGMDIANIVGRRASDNSFSITLASVHPDSFTVVTVTQGNVSEASLTGFSHVPFNALDERGLVMMIEVRVIVWKIGR